MTSHYGTPIYMAPEVLQGRNHNLSADIWSLGVTLYQLIMGCYPFDGSSRSELRASHQMGNYVFYDFISADCIDFICHCLQNDPKKRASAKELL